MYTSDKKIGKKNLKDISITLNNYLFYIDTVLVVSDKDTLFEKGLIAISEVGAISINKSKDVAESEKIIRDTIKIFEKIVGTDNLEDFLSHKPDFDKWFEGFVTNVISKYI